MRKQKIELIQTYPEGWNVKIERGGKSITYKAIMENEKNDTGCSFTMDFSPYPSCCGIAILSGLTFDIDDFDPYISIKPDPITKAAIKVLALGLKDVQDDIFEVFHRNVFQAVIPHECMVDDEDVPEDATAPGKEWAPQAEFMIPDLVFKAAGYKIVTPAKVNHNTMNALMLYQNGIWAEHDEDSW